MWKMLHSALNAPVYQKCGLPKLFNNNNCNVFLLLLASGVAKLLYEEIESQTLLNIPKHYLTKWGITRSFLVHKFGKTKDFTTE